MEIHIDDVTLNICLRSFQVIQRQYRKRGGITIWNVWRERLTFKAEIGQPLKIFASNSSKQNAKNDRQRGHAVTFSTTSTRAYVLRMPAAYRPPNNSVQLLIIFTDIPSFHNRPALFLTVRPAVRVASVSTIVGTGTLCRTLLGSLQPSGWLDQQLEWGKLFKLIENNKQLENVAIGRHCNLRPPGLRATPSSGKIVIPENSTWPYLNARKISTF